MAVVYNILQTPGGAPLENHTVTIDLLTSGNPFTISDSEVVFRTTAVTDSTGRWEKELPPQSAYEQINTRYVVEQGDKPGHKWYFEVPNEGTYWLRDLIDVEFPGPYPAQAPVEPHRLAAHSDVNTDGAVDDDGLTFDTATGFWTPGHPTPAAHTHPQAEVVGLQGRFEVIEETLDAATPESTPLTLVERDTAGRAQMSDPAVAGDVATKGYADLMVPLAQKATADGVASLDANALIPNNQLPALAISDTHPVASEAAMLALTAQIGDVAVRTDVSRSYILRATPASTLGNWSELLTPPDAVSSVNGQVGVVSLSSADVGALDSATRVPLSLMPTDLSTVAPLPSLNSRVSALEQQALPKCVLTKSANQSVPDATDTTVTWDVAAHDPSGMRSGNTITIQETGMYLVSPQVNIAPGGTIAGDCVLYVSLNDPTRSQYIGDTAITGFGQPSANGGGLGNGLTSTVVREFTAGDVLTVVVYQRSGVARNARYTAFGGCRFSVSMVL